ncbi:hypothetical protein D0Y65_033341 [Glycine soja]|uniref:Uncharacterized protein n=1 Tax=Glycine soja TaxID=3848 RepID=A0A445HKK3_GLYSO|nr:hypothetical protein D0Y65_033341 [Glycine soja]
MSWKFLIRSRLSYLARMQRMSPYTDSTPNESIVMWEKIGLWSWIEPLLNNVESFSEMVFKCLKSFSAENTSGKSGFGCVLRDGEGNFVQGGLML